MNSLWENLYDRVKDRRYGQLFLMVWIAVLGVLTIVRLGEEILTEEPSPLIEGIMAIGLVLLSVPVVRAGVGCFQNRRHRGDGTDRSRLSSDELVKARSKLRNRIRSVGTPAQRAPDIDLKF